MGRGRLPILLKHAEAVNQNRQSGGDVLTTQKRDWIVQTIQGKKWERQATGPSLEQPSPKAHGGTNLWLGSRGRMMTDDEVLRTSGLAAKGRCLLAKPVLETITNKTILPAVLNRMVSRMAKIAKPDNPIRRDRWEHGIAQRELKAEAE